MTYNEMYSPPPEEAPPLIWPTSEPGADLYQNDVRRSYDQLLDIADSLDDREQALGRLGETVARFVEQIVWADQRIAGSEAEAIAALVQVDTDRGGMLGECLRNPCGDLTELSRLPHFLKDCAAQENPKLGPAALDAFESLGISLMASDREIAESELDLLQTLMGAWRQEMAAGAVEG